MFYVYIIKSKKDSKFYTGLTNNLDRRLYEHNHGQVKSTKSRKPFELIYQEIFDTRKQAREKEKWFKSGEGREFRSKL